MHSLELPIRLSPSGASCEFFILENKPLNSLGVPHVACPSALSRQEELETPLKYLKLNNNQHQVICLSQHVSNK